MKQYFLICSLLFLPSMSLLHAQERKVYTLDQAVELALNNNHSLELAETKTELAEAKLQQVKDKALPTLGTAIQYSRLYNLTDFVFEMGGQPVFALPQTHVDAMIGLTSASKEIFGGFYEKYNHEMNEYLVLANQSDFDKNKTDLKYAVTGLYYTIYKIEKSIEILDENLLRLEAKEKDVENFYKEGILTSNDVLKIQLQKNNLQITRLDAQNMHDIALNKLAVLMGLTENDQIAIDPNVAMNYGIVYSGQQLQQLSLDNRKELQTINYQLKASETSYKLLQSAYYPHLDLSVTHIYLNPVAETYFIPRKNQYINMLNVGLSLKYSFSSLYALKGKKMEIRATIDQAQHYYEVTQDQIRQEVYAQEKTYDSALKKIDVAQLALEQAQLNYTQVESRFNNGLVLSSDLIDAQALLQSAELSLLNAKTDAQLAYYQLEKATGTTIK